jgi:hypothetical protein
VPGYLRTTLGTPEVNSAQDRRRQWEEKVFAGKRKVRGRSPVPASTGDSSLSFAEGEKGQEHGPACAPAYSAAHTGGPAAGKQRRYPSGTNCGPAAETKYESDWCEIQQRKSQPVKWRVRCSARSLLVQAKPSTQEMHVT